MDLVSQVSWGPLRPWGGSATPAPTSFHTGPRSLATHYTLNLYYNGSLSFNNIFFLPPLSHFLSLRRFAYVSDIYPKFGRLSLHAARHLRTVFFKWEKSLLETSTCALTTLKTSPQTEFSNTAYLCCKYHTHTCKKTHAHNNNCSVNSPQWH